MLRIEVIGEISRKSDLASAWDDLHLHSPQAHPFHSLPWVHSWLETRRQVGQLKILAFYDGNDLVGIFPLREVRRAWAATEQVGIGSSDILSPLTAPGYGSKVAEAFADWAQNRILHLQQVRQGDPLLDVFPNIHHHAQAECPVLTLPSTMEEYIGTLSKSLRYDVRKALKSNPDIRVATPDTVQEDLEVFFQLHEMRWKTKKQLGAFALGGLKRFHRVSAPAMVQAGLLRLLTLRSEGRPIGSLYCFRAGTGMFFYQSGFDPQEKSKNPGTTLIAHAVRMAIDDGCKVFDFLRGAEPYKLRWGPQDILHNYRILVPGLSAGGRLAERCNLFGAHWEKKIRSKLEGTSKNS